MSPDDPDGGQPDRTRLLEERPRTSINGAGGDDVLIGGGGNDYLTSGDGNDKAFGEAGNDTLLGADGNDYLNGGADNDLIVGNGGADTLMGDAGDDYLNGGDGDDLVVGNDGTDTLLGDIGNDYLDGGAGPDTLFGNAGNDTVLGGDGEDYVNGGDGEDVVFGGAGNDTVVGESGNDDINGETGNDVVFGGAGNDTVLGADGDDYLAGDAGDDNLAGGIGNDTLFAGSGSDYLQGDAGDDMFVFEASFGTSLIIDFEIGSAAHHDVVQFKGGVFANLADVLAHAVQDGTNLVITTSTGDTLTLANVLKANSDGRPFRLRVSGRNGRTSGWRSSPAKRGRGTMRSMVEGAPARRVATTKRDPRHIVRPLYDRARPRPLHRLRRSPSPAARVEPQGLFAILTREAGRGPCEHGGGRPCP